MPMQKWLWHCLARFGRIEMTGDPAVGPPVERSACVHPARGSGHCSNTADTVPAMTLGPFGRLPGASRNRPAHASR